MTLRWLLGLSLVVPLSAMGQTTSVCLVDVTDTGSQMSMAAAVKTLEAELARSFVVVSNKKVGVAARALRLARSAWQTPEGLVHLRGRLSCDLALTGRFSSGLGARMFFLTAFGADGKEAGAAYVLVSRSRLTADQAKALTASLAEKISVTRPAAAGTTAPPEPTAKPTAVDPTWDDATAGFAPVPTGAARVAEATEASAPSVVEAIRLDTAIEVGGRVAFEHYGFFETPDQAHLGGRDNVEAAVHVKAIHPRATAYASLLARADFVDPSRNRFDPEEAWVDLTFPSVSVKAGRLISSWGSASLYNPTDVLNPVDYRDPLDPEKVGTLMLKMTATVGPFTIEASYLPVPETHRLPAVTGISPSGAIESRSRWLRGSINVPGSVPLTFHVAPFASPMPSAATTQAAARVEFSVAGADIGVGYAFLIDHLPSAHLEAVAERGVPLGADVFVDWQYRRLQVFALDVERVFGKLRLAAEGAAFLTADRAARDSRVADPYLIFDVGGDYQTGQFFGDQRVHLFLEFTGARALRGALATEGVDLLRYPFPLAVLGRVSWEIGQDLRVEVNAVSSVERFDVLISPRVEYSFFDRVKARVGVDVLAGDSKGFFGRFADNSRFITTVEARF